MFLLYYLSHSNLNEEEEEKEMKMKHAYTFYTGTGLYTSHYFIKFLYHHHNLYM